MKRGTFVLTITGGLVIALGASAELGGQTGEGAATRAPLSKEPITARVARMPVKTVKTEVPIEKAVRSDTPQFRGEGLFFQRCSLCHLGEWRKAGQVQAYAPALTGVLKDPSREAAVRSYIRTGSTNMPGFANTFTASQLDDLIAYLRSL